MKKISFSENVSQSLLERELINEFMGIEQEGNCVSHMVVSPNILANFRRENLLRKSPFRQNTPELFVQRRLAGTFWSAYVYVAPSEKYITLFDETECDFYMKYPILKKILHGINLIH